MIALASDHVGLPLKQAIARYLKARGMAYQDYGTRDVDRCDYPIYGYQAARAVADGICDKGILCCEEYDQRWDDGDQ